jgi:hypothetical protein
MHSSSSTVMVYVTDRGSIDQHDLFCGGSLLGWTATALAAGAGGVLSCKLLPISAAGIE